MNALTGTKISMSSAHHPQTDGLAERNIQTVIEALRTFCCFEQTKVNGLTMDWTDYLFQFEYAHNSSVHATTGVIPYIAEKGWIPRGTIDVMKDSLPLQSGPIDPAGKEAALMLQTARDRARAAIQAAYEYAEKRWNAKHRPVTYQPGDLVKVSSKFFAFKDVPNKLKSAFVGSFEVIEMVGTNAVRLQMEGVYLRRHTVYPVCLTELFRESPSNRDSRPQYEITRPPPLNNEGEEDVFEVDRILSERETRGKNGRIVRSFLVHWKGYPDSENCWVTECNVNAPELLREYRASKRRLME